MSFAQCAALIPVYNHGKTVGNVIQELRSFGLPVILVDDGSDAKTKEELSAVCARFSETAFVTLERNGGKGAAVTAGFLEAQKRGYSHVLQIDADGQHDLSAVSFFLKALAKHPEDLMGGLPQYDASIPSARAYGRKITNFWVAVNTLSCDIPDAMCGFRIYPVDRCCSIVRRGLWDYRMGFDIEILVRLYWEGVRLRFYPVHVVYPHGGISHFRAVRDNFGISKTHALLFFGMLWRLPRLLWRKRKRNGKG